MHLLNGQVQCRDVERASADRRAQAVSAARAAVAAVRHRVLDLLGDGKRVFNGTSSDGLFYK